MPFSFDAQLTNTNSHFKVYFDEGQRWDRSRRSWLTAQGILWLGIGAERGYFAIEPVHSILKNALDREDASGLGAIDPLWQERMPPRLMPRIFQWVANGVTQQEGEGAEPAALAFRDAYSVATQLVSTQREALRIIASIMFEPQWNAMALETSALVEVFGYLQSVSDIVNSIAERTGRTDYRLVDDVALAFTSQLNLAYGPVRARLSDTGVVLADRTADAVFDLPLRDATDDEIGRARGLLNEARENWRVQVHVLLERLDAALSSDAMAV